MSNDNEKQSLKESKNEERFKITMEKFGLSSYEDTDMDKMLINEARGEGDDPDDSPDYNPPEDKDEPGEASTVLKDVEIDEVGTRMENDEEYSEEEEMDKIKSIEDLSDELVDMHDDDMMNEIDEIRKNSDNFLSFFAAVTKYYPINEFSKNQQEKVLKYLEKCSGEMSNLKEDEISKFLNNEI